MIAMLHPAPPVDRGPPLADPDTRRRRLAVCDGGDAGPPCRWYECRSGRCEADGRFPALSAWHRAATCPRGLW